MHLLIDMMNSEVGICMVGESGETSLLFLVPQVHERVFVHVFRDCNLQNEQCFTGTAIRPESPHIDRVCRSFLTRYVCSGFVQELEIIANQIKIDEVGVACKLNGDTCVRKP